MMPCVESAAEGEEVEVEQEVVAGKELPQGLKAKPPASIKI
jgi:hypothetical protein